MRRQGEVFFSERNLTVFIGQVPFCLSPRSIEEIKKV